MIGTCDGAATAWRAADVCNGPVGPRGGGLRRMHRRAARLMSEALKLGLTPVRKLTGMNQPVGDI